MVNSLFRFIKTKTIKRLRDETTHPFSYKRKVVFIDNKAEPCSVLYNQMFHCSGLTWSAMASSLWRLTLANISEQYLDGYYHVMTLITQFIDIMEPLFL